MRATLPPLDLLVLLYLAQPSEAGGSSNCKCVPSDPCWPTNADWDSLNATVSGRLLRTALPASVCYPSDEHYQPAACEALISDWTTSVFHSNDPVSIPDPTFANNSCNPIYHNGTSIAGDPTAGSRGCSIGNYPPYVVNAAEASHVQAAIKFATDKNLRLNVKNTGHSSSRAVAHGSLSIWTHHMKSFEFHKHFAPSQCHANSSDAHMAATFGAGTQDAEAFEQAGKNNAIMVGGTNKDVGIVGWAMGGGHGFMTTTYGMGADNIIEASIVTLAGEVVTANACQNSDLFWAIRGGGSGFGVVLNVTMKAYRMPPVNFGFFSLVAKNSTSTREWWRTVARVHALLPDMHEAGFQGYYVIAAGETRSFGLNLFNYNASNATVQAAWQPFAATLHAFENVSTVATSMSRIPSFLELYNAFPDPSDSSGQGGGTRTSRLMPRAALKDDVELLASVLEHVGPKRTASTGPISDNRIVGNMIASSAPVDNSLNPAWRDAVLHLIVDNSWDDSLPAEEAAKADYQMTHVTGRALRQLAPDSGAYINEADLNEPNWQWALYGPNYSKLRSIKHKRDPHALLWCATCVGGEEWFEDGDGKLCQAEWVV